MSKRQRIIGFACLLLLVAVAGGFWAEWRHLRGRNQCPHCAAYGKYEATTENGNQVLVCHQCEREFIAEVKNGRFTFRNQKR